MRRWLPIASAQWAAYAHGMLRLQICFAFILECIDEVEFAC